ncbi:MAG: hypothetical protein K2X81_00590, partial [Candidatus Obscuribacterales bacterium]|nr:hypothetical protein [Candidatus Obscuribacterales bacterium]
MKILLATDGSANAEAALDVVLYRPWEETTQVRVVCVAEPLNEQINKMVGLFGLAKSAVEAQKRYLEQTQELLNGYVAKLSAKFGADNVSANIMHGKPKEM